MRRRSARRALQRRSAAATKLVIGVSGAPNTTTVDLGSITFCPPAADEPVQSYPVASQPRFAEHVSLKTRIRRDGLDAFAPGNDLYSFTVVGLSV